jgi:hypothetical protein
MVTYVIISDKFKAGLSSSTSTCKACRVAQMLSLNLGSGNNPLHRRSKQVSFVFLFPMLHAPSCRNYFQNNSTEVVGIICYQSP